MQMRPSVTTRWRAGKEFLNCWRQDPPAVNRIHLCACLKQLIYASLMTHLGAMGCRWPGKLPSVGWGRQADAWRYLVVADCFGCCVENEELDRRALSWLRCRGVVGRGGGGTSPAWAVYWSSLCKVLTRSPALHQTESSEARRVYCPSAAKQRDKTQKKQQPRWGGSAERERWCVFTNAVWVYFKPGAVA